MHSCCSRHAAVVNSLCSPSVAALGPLIRCMRCAEAVRGSVMQHTVAAALLPLDDLMFCPLVAAAAGEAAGGRDPQHVAS